ncbi:MAG: PTS sugar transporter subunit IIA [Phycisphaerae bacterium]|nr:PTS sugar transporter subunit IIA [Phycisphaerae bacterium]MCZ2400461.1 PTS sugar transporter subunit IIA [Phycisphaerae bacterium]NUQ49389.1 PTS sugar transporter subunit IIA [Phycisphaerae bacterium]
MPYRNMNIAELARHIGMDAREVKRLAEKGVLPGQMVGGEWRFNRAQMLDWLQRELHSLRPEQIRNLERAMSDVEDEALFGRLLGPEAVNMNLPARSRTSVLHELVALAEHTGMLYDKPALVRALEEREALGSTALAGGYAFPHPRRPMPYATAEPLACLARVPGGIPFGAPDGGLTYVFVLVCSHDERQHLQTLARLALLFGSALPQQLRDMDDALEVVALVIATERELLSKRR